MEKLLGTELTEIGLRIRKARKEKGLTQTELGTEIGKSLRAVQMYEKGQTDLSIALLNDIAKALDVNTTDLIGYETPEVPATTLSDALAMLFRLSDLEDLKFDIEIRRPPHYDGWECSLTFNGKDEAKHNADFCLALESFRDELADVESGRRTKEQYEQWKDEMLAYYSGSILN